MSAAKTEQEKPQFNGFKPRAGAILRDLAEHQDNADWYLAHKTDYETYVEAPMGMLLAALVARSKSLALPLHAPAVRGVSRRPQRAGRRYHTSVRGILYACNASPGSITVDYGPLTSSVGIGFHGMGRDQVAAVARSIEADPAYWATSEKILNTAGLHFLKPLREAVADAAGETHRNKPADLIATTTFSSTTLAVGKGVDDIVQLAQAAALFMNRGGELFVAIKGRRVISSVDSLGN